MDKSINGGNKRKNRLGVLDWFIIVAVVICAAVVGLRFYRTSALDVNSSAELEEYIVTFEVSNIRSTSAEFYFGQGTKFYFSDNDECFGELRDVSRVADAETLYELLDGEIVAVNNNGRNDLHKVDVEANLTVSGKTDSNGCFIVNGNRYIAPGKEFDVYTKYLSVKMKITGITKAE